MRPAAKGTPRSGSIGVASHKGQLQTPPGWFGSWGTAYGSVLCPAQASSGFAASTDALRLGGSEAGALPGAVLYARPRHRERSVKQLVSFKKASCVRPTPKRLRRSRFPRAGGCSQ